MRIGLSVQEDLQSKLMEIIFLGSYQDFVEYKNIRTSVKENCEIH